MKRQWRIGAVLILVCFGLVTVMPAASALGLWKTVDEKTHRVRSIVRIWEENGRLKGRVEKGFPEPGEDPNEPCSKCPEPFKDKPKIGLEFLWGFVPDGDRWVNGSVLDPDEGKIYRCELIPAADGKSMRIFGYIRVIFKIGRSQTWLRASEADLKG
jgi:uncharacterized protein (DUF2147 family)